MVRFVGAKDRAGDTTIVNGSRALRDTADERTNADAKM
jgi:hypothetical protein